MGEAGYLEDHAIFNDGLSGLKMHILCSLPSLADLEGWLGLWQRHMSCGASCWDAEHTACASGPPLILTRSQGLPTPVASCRGHGLEQMLVLEASSQCPCAVPNPGAAAGLMPTPGLCEPNTPGSPGGLDVPPRRSLSLISKPIFP